MLSVGPCTRGSLLHRNHLVLSIGAKYTVGKQKTLSCPVVNTQYMERLLKYSRSTLQNQRFNFKHINCFFLWQTALAEEISRSLSVTVTLGFSEFLLSRSRHAHFLKNFTPPPRKRWIRTPLLYVFTLFCHFGCTQKEISTWSGNNQCCFCCRK